MLGIRRETEDQPAWNWATAERIQSAGHRWKEGATSGVQLACFVWCSTRIWAYSAEQGCQGRMTSGHTDTATWQWKGQCWRREGKDSGLIYNEHFPTHKCQVFSKTNCWAHHLLCMRLLMNQLHCSGYEQMKPSVRRYR